MPNYSLCKEFLSDIQTKLSLTELKPVLSCSTVGCVREETNPHLATTTFQVVVESDKVSPEPPLLQAKQSQVPQPFLTGLGPMSLPWALLLFSGPLQHLNIFPEWKGPKLNTILKVWPHQCRIQGKDHFPGPAGHTILDTGQDAIGLLGHLGTLLAHVQPPANPNRQVPFCLAALQPLCPQPTVLHGIVVTKVQDLALGLVKPHPIGISPTLKSVQVPLQSPPAFQLIDTPSQLGVTCKLANDGLNPLI
ncbi:hypothetical protein WISP_86616 [Willisornis vidua]|uniref:Uncharacterized protein n=1 Tax=Willisornis vidua TaxID=1566151 RepID=A0ABQ9D8R9_9PASS|nr:hypothetical protein WISP_86616 [Willisornis vidua]